jgi:ABC-type uncharacterized transport system involved in gliding motility auxiliary subunit
LDVLTAYLNRNGRLLCMFDPGYAPETAAFLQAYGVTMDNTTIINANPLGQLMGAGPTMPVVTTFGQHPITETFTAASIFPLARSLTVEETLPEGISVDTLAFSSESSWGETSQEELESGTVELTEGSDIPGPLPLAVIITVASPVPVEGTEIETRDETETGAADEAESTGARIVVFGDSDFASNAYVGWVGNGDLVLNTLNWLAEEEDLVAIRAKDPEMSPLMLTAAQARMAFLLAVIVMPLAAIMIGVTIYVNRQKATR